MKHEPLLEEPVSRDQHLRTNIRPCHVHYLPKNKALEGCQVQREDAMYDTYGPRTVSITDEVSSPTLSRIRSQEHSVSSSCV